MGLIFQLKYVVTFVYLLYVSHTRKIKIIKSILIFSLIDQYKLKLYLVKGFFLKNDELGHKNQFSFELSNQALKRVKPKRKKNNVLYNTLLLLFIILSIKKKIVANYEHEI